MQDDRENQQKMLTEINRRLDRIENRLERLSDKMDAIRAIFNVSLSDVTMIIICLCVMYFVLTH